MYLIFLVGLSLTLGFIGAVIWTIFEYFFTDKKQR